MKLLISLFLLNLFFTTVSFAKIYKFSADTVSISNKQQQQLHPVSQVGYASFKNNVKVPVFTIGVPDTIEDGIRYNDTHCKTGCYFNMSLNPQLASQVKVFNLIGNGFILVPRQWNRFEAQLGVNGNAVFKIQSNDGKSTLMTYDVPACVGCGVDSASIYFPEANQRNKKVFQTFYTGNNANLKTVRANKETVYFQYQLPNHFQTNGVAKYRPNEDELFNMLRITLPKEQKELARQILNFYSLTH